jgi:Protein of unknown function (DUF3768)
MIDDTMRRTAALNDAFRTTLMGGKAYLTAGVEALGPEVVAEVISKVRTFSDFDAGNDPYGEHDFGAVEIAGQRLFWKIDYFDAGDPDLGAEDPSDATTTERALTIMLAEEY